MKQPELLARPGVRRVCARCSFPLQALSNGQVEIDHCGRCGGYFLDPGEGRALFGESADPAYWFGAGAARDVGPTTMRCPGDGQVLHAYVLSGQTTAGAVDEVEVDFCQSCRGVWLDQGEGERLAALARDAAPADADERPGKASYFFQLFTGMPIEAWNPVRRPPWIVRSLVVVLAAIFALQVFGPWPIAETYSLRPSEFLRGHRYHTVLTHAFLHGGLFHLLGNLYFLYTFGDNIESDLGKRRFTAIYLTAAIVAGVAQVGLGPIGTSAILGASGAIAALIGTYWVLYPRVKLWVVWFFFRFRVATWLWIGLWLAFNLLGAYLGQGAIAYWAHIGGFVVGVIAGIAMRPRVAKLYADVQQVT